MNRTARPVRGTQIIAGRFKQRVDLNGTKYAWRTASWCKTHEDLAWRYGDGEVQCMYQLVVESHDDTCVTVPLSVRSKP